MKNKIKNLKNIKVVRNASWIMLERIFQMIISVFIGMFSARYLGPSNYGIISYGLSFVTLFVSFCKLGLDGIIVKEIVQNKDDEGTIVGTSIFMRIISSFISILMILILIFILKPNDKLTRLVVFLQSISLIFQSFDLIDFWFQAKLKSKYIAISKSIAYIIVSTYKVYLLITGKSVIWFAFTTTLEYILLTMLYLYMYKRNGGQKFKYSKEIGKTLLKQSYHFIFTALISSLYAQMDKIMLGSYLSTEQVGLYSVATVLCSYWSFIPDAIINSARPVIFEKKKCDEKIYHRRLRQLYAIIFWSGMVFFIGTLLFSKLAINILYGKEYLGSSTCFIIHSLCTTFAYLGSARGIWIISENKNKYAKYYVLFGGVVNLILNILLIPLIGIEGAALATLVTQIFVALIAPLFYKETRISVKYILQGILLKDVM